MLAGERLGNLELVLKFRAERFFGGSIVSQGVKGADDEKADSSSKALVYSCLVELLLSQESE